MSSVLLMLMLSITRTQSLSSCPASCVVCSDDAVICHKLSNVIEAPETTKALMLTDGAIVSVDRHFLSDMSNMTVLSLSHNAITTLTHNAFQNLTILHTLLLDHNHLSSQTLDRATFSWLPRLEILQLGNNVLREVKGSWFHATRALRTLQLGGNLLTRLDATTFASADLRGLETLDLSDNLITYLGRDSFRGLPGLRSLDLSRNQLRNALPEAFSYLSWLTSLNLELNRWNCTCELRELASFLTSYMEAPDKVLFNGRRMVCVSADNPAVKTVLELTEANCVPPNQNITVQVEAKNSVSPQRYTRDLALAAAFCFAGGVGLTLVVVYIIYHKLETNKRDRTGAKEEENRRTAPTQTVPQWDLSRENQALHLAQMGLETKLMLPNSNQQGSHLQPWERERAMYDLRMGKDGCHFTCPNCGPAVTGSAVEQGGGVEHINTLDMLRQGGAQPNKMGSLAIIDERRRHVPTQALISKMEDLRGQRSFNRPPEGQSNHTLSHQELLYHQQGYKKHGPNGNNQPLGGSNSYFSPAQRSMSTHNGLKDEMARPGNYIDNKQSNMNFQPESGRPVTDYQPQTASCVNCHRTYEYRQPGDKARDVSYGPHARESAGYEGFPNHNQLTRQNMGKNMNYNQSNVDIYAKHAGEQRSVTFDLERSRVHVVDVQKMNRDREGKHDRIQSSRKAEYGDKQTLRYEGSGRSARSNALEREDNSKRHKHKVQSNGLLKVKLNLNPLKKSKVHPRKNSHKNLEQGDREPTNSKNRKQLKTRGKDVKGKSHHQDESESKGKTDKSSKGNSTAKNKANQTSKNTSTVSKSKEIDDNYEDNESEEEEEKEDPVPQQNKASSKQKKTTSKSKQEHQEGSNDHPKKSRAAQDQKKADISQNRTGGVTEESGEAPIPSNLSPYQSDPNRAGGSSANGQQVKQYKNGQGQALIPEVPQHHRYLGDGVPLQRALSNPQLSAAHPLTGMEITSSYSNLPVQGGNSVLLQNTVAPNPAYGGKLQPQSLSRQGSLDDLQAQSLSRQGSLDNLQAQSLSKQGRLSPPPLLTNIPHTFPLYTGNAGSLPVNPFIPLLSQPVSGNFNQEAMIGSQTAQFPALQSVEDLTLLAQGAGSLIGQNISPIAQGSGSGPGSLNGENLSNNNSMNAASTAACSTGVPNLSRRLTQKD